MELWQCLPIFDPRKLPETLSELSADGHKGLDELINHYGRAKSSDKFGELHIQAPDISETEVKTEFEGFKFLMFTKHIEWENCLDILLCKETSKEVADSLKIKQNSFSPQELWNSIAKDTVNLSLYPNCMVLFKLLMIFPLSAACVERLFSKLTFETNSAKIHWKVCWWLQRKDQKKVLAMTYSSILLTN